MAPTSHTPTSRIVRRLIRFDRKNREVSKQRRRLRDFQRPQKHGAVNEAQRKRPRLSAFQLRLLAERIDANSDADIGVLLDHLAEARNGLVERAEDGLELEL